MFKPRIYVQVKYNYNTGIHISHRNALPPHISHQTYTHPHPHTSMQVFMHTDTYKWMCTHTHTRTRAHAHAHTHTHTHTHAHTHRLLDPNDLLHSTLSHHVFMACTTVCITTHTDHTSMYATSEIDQTCTHT